MAPRPTSEITDWQPVQQDPGDWATVTDWQPTSPPKTEKPYDASKRGAKMKGTPQTPPPLQPMESGVNDISSGVQEMNEGGANRSWWNPIPSSKELGGISKVVRGAGKVALPYAVAANPVGAAIGLGAGIPAGMATEAVAKAVGVPAGTSEFMGDVAGFGAGGVAASVGPRLIGRSAATVATRLGAPEALERSAGKSYRKMLTPSAQNVVPQAESIAGGPSPSGPTGLVKDRPVALTRGRMMKQMQQKMAEIGPQTATVYDNKPPLDPKPILDHLETLRQQKAIANGTDVVTDPGLDRAINELKQNLEDMRGEDGKISAKTLDDFKDKLNRGLVNPQGHLRALPPQSSGMIEKSTAGQIGKHLDTAYPDAAKVNAAYRTSAQTNKFLEQARRKEIAAESGIKTGASSGFGAAIKKTIPAPLRGIPNAISSLTDSVAWDAAMGASKAKMADVIRGGIKPAIQPPPPAAAAPSPVAPPVPSAAGHQTGPLAMTPGEAYVHNTQGPGAWDTLSPFIKEHYEDIAASIALRERPKEFARGGVIRKPTLLSDLKTGKPTGIMAEAGPERIVPLTAPNSKFNLRRQMKHIFAGATSAPPPFRMPKGAS